MKNILFLIISWIGCSTILGGTIDPNISDSKYLAYGEKFKYVHRVCGKYHNKELFCASSVAINDHWLLTAAHVVDKADTCVIHHNNTILLVDKIICHKNFHMDKFGYNDIALLHVEESINLDFYPDLYDNRDEVNKVCSISGYGLTGTFRTGIVKSDTNRRAGSNIIDKVDRELLICTPSISNNKTELEFLIGSGDSGGGLFINNKLAGINSCVMADDKKPDSTYGDESGHTRISTYIEWINQNINEN